MIAGTAYRPSVRPDGFSNEGRMRKTRGSIIPNARKHTQGASSIHATLHNETAKTQGATPSSFNADAEEVYSYRRRVLLL